jgi:hypothetical protein
VYNITKRKQSAQVPKKGCRAIDEFMNGTSRVVLKLYATRRKVAVSIPDEVIDFFFNLRNPSSRTMTLGSTQPLTESSTKNFSGRGGVKGGRRVKADNLTICELVCL